MSLRDYGYGDSTGFVRGTPRVVMKAPIACPNCGCETFQIEVDVKTPMLKGDGGVGMYVGCPACPWASPMIMMGGSSKGGVE